jgi:translation initiation factor 2 beta subunit (eIF-2beta)/eIF-5
MEELMKFSSEYVICPYCDNEHGGCWEWITDEKLHEMECSECGQSFKYWAETSVIYNTMKVNKNDKS